MKPVFILLFLTAVWAYASACGQSGWTGWINNAKPTTTLFPEEKGEVGITSGGGDKENMNSVDRNAFCVPGHGTFTKMQCVSASGKYNISDSDMPPHGIECDIDDGLTCLHRVLNKTRHEMCEDFKIRLYCACTDPISTTPPPPTSSGEQPKSTQSSGNAGSKTASPGGGNGGANTGIGGSGNSGNTGGGSGAGTGGTGGGSGSGNNGGGNSAANVVISKLGLLLMLFAPCLLQ